MTQKGLRKQENYLMRYFDLYAQFFIEHNCHQTNED